MAEVPPSRTSDQRQAALARANEIRVLRARLKRDIRGGESRLEDVLGEPPTYVRSAKVTDLLVAVPGVGPTRATRLLKRCAISEAKTVGGLTERQRSALINLL